MPLETGSSRAVISRNIATEVRAGNPPAQAAAIAYSKAREDGMTIDEKLAAQKDRRDGEPRMSLKDLKAWLARNEKELANPRTAMHRHRYLSEETPGIRKQIAEAEAAEKAKGRSRADEFMEKLDAAASIMGGVVQRLDALEQTGR